MSNWYEPESQIIGIKLELSDGLAEAEITWKDKNGGPVLRHLELMSQVPTSGEAAEEFAAARKAILRVVSRIEEGNFSVDGDEEPDDGLGWS